jgi:hypothetical protein
MSTLAKNKMKLCQYKSEECFVDLTAKRQTEREKKKEILYFHVAMR